MRLLFALSGFHRYDRGAETALLSVADELARNGADVVVAGGGTLRPGTAYKFVHVPALAREKFEGLPAIPFLRDEVRWEDASFAFNLPRRLDLNAFDATFTCAFPFTNLRLRRFGRKPHPAHFFVTQNGDWPARSDKLEFRLFSCDGLVCTNPEYYAHNQERWNCALVPNGIDMDRFSPGKAMRAKFDLPQDKQIILMVSAFINSKRVLEGIRAVSRLENAFLVVAGDGPMRAEGDRLAAELLPGNYRRISVAAHDMPELYRSADVFLHMSKFESFGNVYLEAAASGLPVVAHDNSITRWILGDAPFLCDTGDETELLLNLERALTAGPQQIDQSLARFTWPAIAAQYRSFVEQTLAARAVRQ